MKYNIFNDVYEANKELDKMFDNEFKDSEMIKKNKLELLVEIGELANETRYFKYWSNKEVNLDLVKEEYADCLIMILYFFNILNINLDEDFIEIEEYDKVDIFARLYKLASEFYYDNNKELIKEVFVTLINLGYLIGFTNEDIIKTSLSKINKNKSMFKENN